MTMSFKIGINVVKVSMLVLMFIFKVHAETSTYNKQESIYKNLCEQLERPNVDCQCVAKSHATYAHLSPNNQYADFLIESYKKQLGLPNQKVNAFERYVDGRPMNQVQFEMYDAFNEYESANPFTEEVIGCVIPQAPKVQLSPLPTAAIFKEVYDYRVSSTGTKRLEQCQLFETNNVLNSKQLTALHYYNYRGFRGEELTNKLNIPAQEVKETAFNATQKLEDYQKNTRNITNYCLSLLVAEEGSTGNLISRYVRSDAQRKGPPVGLENINVQQGLLPASNSLEDEISSLSKQAEAIKTKNREQTSKKDLMSNIKGSEEYQQATAFKRTPAEKATASLISRGCLGSGNSETFCTCFVEGFMSDVGASGGAAALPVIQDGITMNEMMGLMNSIDQSRYMQDMSAVQTISLKCENLND